MASITFGNIHVYLSKEELVRRLFPNLPKELREHVEIIQNEGPDGRAELEFEFQLFPEGNPEQLEDLKKEVENLSKEESSIRPDNDQILKKRLLDLSFEDFSVRSRNSLLPWMSENNGKSKESQTMQDLINIRWGDQYKIRNFGKRSRKELAMLLLKYGLKISDQPVSQ